jgi:hypothetical protein
MKIQKTKRGQAGYETVVSRNLRGHIDQGQLVINAGTFDGRTPDYRVVFTADELIELANKACKAASGNSPVDLIVNWKARG